MADFPEDERCAEFDCPRSGEVKVLVEEAYGGGVFAQLCGEHFEALSRTFMDNARGNVRRFPEVDDA